ncbi:MAG: phage tail tube protein [Amphiplicatus sp.]
MTSSNKHRLIRARESSLGVAPVAGYRRAWIVNETFRPEDTFEQSQTITGDRLIAALLRTGARVTGQLDAEFAFKQCDYGFEMGMLNIYSETPEADGTEIASVTASSDTIATNNGAIFNVGDLVQVSGMANAANNGIFVAIAGTMTNAVVIGGGGTLVDETPGAAARVKVVGVQGVSGDITATATGLGSTTMNWAARPWIKAGMACKIGGPSGGAAGLRFDTAALNRFATVKTPTATALPLDDRGASWATDAGASKTIRVYFGDFLEHGDAATMPTETHEAVLLGQGAPVHVRFSALACNQMIMNLQRRARIQPQFNMIGFSDSYAGAETDAPDTDAFIQPMVTGDNIGEIMVGGLARASHSVIKGLNFDLNNNLQADGPLNNIRDTIYDAGDAILRCGITAKFGSDIDWAAFRSGAQTSLLVPFYASSQGYAMKVWAGKYVDGDRSPGGRNQFVDFRGTIQGFKDPTTGKMLTFTRFENVGI